MQEKLSESSEIKICSSETLPEKGHVVFAVEYRGEPGVGLVVRYDGAVYGYLNLCAHMPRRLDCECPDVFDDRREFLRCSMHGIVYDPVSGEAKSEICAGEHLTPLSVIETEAGILLKDKRARLMSDA